MASFAAQNSTGENFSYKELTTFTKIRECVTLVCITAKLQISLDEQQRITKTWRLLMDYCIAFVIAGLAHNQYNYHCADLIEMFTNIAALAWKSPDPAGGNLNQLAVDLMRQILTADVECYVVPALDAIKDTNVGITKQQNKPENLILTNHWFQSTESTPDRHRATQCLMAADNKSREIWNLTGQIRTLLESIQGDVEWTTDGYVDGIPIYQYTGKQLAKVNDAISDLDLHHRIHTIWDPIAEPTEGNKKTSQPRIQTLPPPTPTISRREPPRRLSHPCFTP